MASITLLQGNITDQEVDAIVNAANRTLMGGGGVDGAIHRTGGPAILEECHRIRTEVYPAGLPTGEAVATTAGELPARWVIHTVGPVYGRAKDAPALLRAAHDSSLRIAHECGAKTIAFPAISTGAYGYPVDEAAPIALSAALRAPASVKEVRFVLFSKSALNIFDEALARL